MSQYGQYQQYPPPQQQQQQQQQSQTPQHQDPYGLHRRSSFAAGDDQVYGANGDQAQNTGYSQSPRVGTNIGSVRMNSQLYTNASSSPALSAGGPFSPHSPPTTHFSYNPQDYAQPLQSPTMQTPPMQTPQSATLPRRPSFPAQPAPYNPADYSESNLQRMSSTAGYGHGFSPGYGNQPMNLTSPVPQPLPSPNLYHNVASRPQQAYTARPTVQTSPYSLTSPSRPSHYTPPAPPPLPAIPGSAESPGEDWGRIPTRYTSTHRPAADTPAYTQPTYASSPPARPNRSSHSNSTGYDQSPYNHSLPPTPGQQPPPPPPPHTATFSSPADHIQSRPLPRLPTDSYPPSSDYFPPSAVDSQPDDVSSERLAQANLENEILGLTSQSPGMGVSSNGVNGGFSDDDTDPEALAGLEAMREAERQDAEDEARRRSGTLTGVYRSSTFFQSLPQVTAASQPVSQAPAGSDSDVPFDLGSYGGGFDARMSYGGDPNQLRIGRNESMSESRSQPVSSSGSMRRSGHASESESYDYDSRPPLSSYPHARVDAFGTGGLADPGAINRRLSYDEGDEAPLTDYSSLAPGEPPPEIMYPPPSMTGRPLPPPPQDAYGAVPYPTDYGSSHHIQFPSAPGYAPSYYQQQPPTGSSLPRHTSLVAHSSTPQVISPARAITDAEQRRRQQQRLSGAPVSDSSGNDTANASTVALDLPSITRKFNPAKLSPRDFDRCREPWALSALVAWLQVMVEGEQFLKKQQLVDALVGLFTYKVPTMNIADAETLSSSLIDEMQHGKDTVLVEEEEWLFFSHEPTSGVIFQLTGTGCYAPRLHETKEAGRCYSYHCQRTEKKVDLTDQSLLTPDEDWASYYKLKKEDTEGKDKKEVERQNILHEIVQKEENYLRELTLLIKLYRDQLRTANPPLIPPKKLQAFLWDVFGKAEAVKKANEEHLLPQLKYRQKEQGPWVVGFSDIFREWIRKAKSAYLEYASQFPAASYKVRQETERNIEFRTFLEKCQANPQSRRLGWDHYLKVPITRLQQVGFLLENALRKSVQDSDEKRNLVIAIDEIKAVTHECDMKVGDGQRRVEMQDLAYKLKLRPGMQRVELNLDHLGRQVLYQGDLLRIGGSRFTWLETHAVLLDNYLVLAKTVTEKTPDGRNAFERYDVSRLPIPMDLLVLESRDDDPVVRAALGGRAAVARAAPNPGAQAQEQLRLARTGSNQSPTPGSITSNNSTTTLGRVPTAQPAPPPPAVTALDGPKDDKTLYPFRVKHLGKETYTLYAPSIQNRDEWCNKIIEARTKHATALYTQNAEPFKLRVMADSAFANDGTITAQKSIIIKDTPLDRAIREVEKMYANGGRPGPVCRARVNCATSFNQPGGKQMVAVGTDFGVYISDLDNPRGWQRVITNPRITQIAVLEEFSLFLLISDKSLIAYHLDVVCPPNGVAPPSDNVRRAPQKLSGSRDVGFFATARMKERCLVFYKKRDGISSTFKILEPVLQKSSERRGRFPPLRSGKTEFFRDFDEFYIPTECMGINIFHSSLAVSTQRGFEILTLDKKQPVSIPDLEASHVQMIAQRLNGQKPLGMFRLSESEFLLCYEECAVYVNKHGDISRSVIMEFVGRARAAAMVGGFVLLFDADFVEVRNAQNGRLRQVIAGRDVRCLDDGLVGASAGDAARRVKIAMQHPELEKVQLVVELVLTGSSDG